MSEPSQTADAFSRVEFIDGSDLCVEVDFVVFGDDEIQIRIGKPLLPFYADAAYDIQYALGIAYGAVIRSRRRYELAHRPPEPAEPPVKPPPRKPSPWERLLRAVREFGVRVRFPVLNGQPAMMKGKC